MAKFETLKQSIAQVIKPNGAQEITGQVMQDTLFSILNVVGTKYAFGGIVMPQTNPESLISDVPSFFIGGAGTYQYFGDPITVYDGQIGVFLWDNAFHSAAVTVVSGDTIMTTPSDQEVTGRKDFRGNITVKDEIMFFIQGTFQHFIKATQWLLKFTDYISGNEFDMDFQNGKLQRKFLGVTSTYLTNTDLADPSNEVTDVAMNGVLSGARGEIKAWNQLVYNGNFTSGTARWYVQDSVASMTVSNNILTVSLSGGANWYNQLVRHTLTPINNTISGHIYLMSLLIKGDTLDAVRLELKAWDDAVEQSIVAGEWNKVTFVKEATSSSNEIRIAPAPNHILAAGAQYMISEVILIDLTAMFGAGNEPTTANEFARRLGYASIDEVPYIPYTSTPIPYNDALSIGGDLLVKRQIGSHEGKLKLVGQIDGVRGRLQDLVQLYKAINATNWHLCTSNPAIATVAYSGNQANVSIVNNMGSDYNDWGLYYQRGPMQQGHKYIIILDIKASVGFNEMAEFALMSFDATYNYSNGRFYVNATMRRQTFFYNGDSGVGVGIMVTPVTFGVSYQVANVMCWDLTEMFGSGNEPTTPQEFASAMGYASIDLLPFALPVDVATHTAFGETLPIAGNAAIEGDSIFLGNGLHIKYDKFTNTVSFADLSGNLATISSQ